MANKLMAIPKDNAKITPSVDYNYWLKRLETNQNSTKVSKVYVLQNFSDYCNKHPNVPYLPRKFVL